MHSASIVATEDLSAAIQYLEERKARIESIDSNEDGTSLIMYDGRPQKIFRPGKLEAPWPYPTIWTDPGLQGSGLSGMNGKSIYPYPYKWTRVASSIEIERITSSNIWTIFYEHYRDNDKHDQLWIQGNGKIDNLHTIERPHGNNQWGDLIVAVFWSTSAPTGDNDNRTIIFSKQRKYTSGRHDSFSLDDSNKRWWQK